jgi:cell division protein ZapA (FtsZ GTPase activity inhibitor)
MGQVTITLNSRTYRLRCGDGEEARLLELADHLRQRIDRLATEFGQIGDDRLLVMAALLVTDELLDAQAVVARGSDGVAIAGVGPPSPGERFPPVPHQLPPPGAPAAPAEGHGRDRTPTLRRPMARASLGDRIAEAREPGPAERKAGGG